MRLTSTCLKERLRSREPLCGTFVKTPHPIIFEVLGLTDLDFAVLDKEHAPFDGTSMDTCLLAARAGGLPVITRLPSASPVEIQTALDMGATGVFIPHIRAASDAEAVVRATRYGIPGGRGYAGSTRAARYTKKTLVDHMADTAAQTAVIATIEDPEAVAHVSAIAAVDGVDGLFIGPMDLTVAYGEKSPEAPPVQRAIARICETGAAAGRGVGIFVGNPERLTCYRDMGITFFLMGSEHIFILNDAARMVAALRECLEK